MLTGQCFCGDIHYQAEAPFTHATICHCTMCRGTTGAPCVAWFTAPRAGFRFTRGAPASFQSSGHGTRSFCPRCGTQLTFDDRRDADGIDITSASLHHPEQMPPASHTYAGSALPWMILGDGLPRRPAGSTS